MLKEHSSWFQAVGIYASYDNFQIIMKNQYNRFSIQKLKTNIQALEWAWLDRAVIECLNKFGSLGRIGRNLNVLPD